MFELIVPPTLAAVLAACTSCFQARSSVVFQWLVLGWAQCQGRRTLTSVALAAGAVGQRHISVFHRFFRRAAWSLDALGQDRLRACIEREDTVGSEVDGRVPHRGHQHLRSRSIVRTSGQPDAGRAAAGPYRGRIRG